MFGYSSMLAEAGALEGGIVLAALTLVGGVLVRQWRRDRESDKRMEKVLDSKEEYSRQLAAQNQSLVVNNTKAMTELTNALKERPCLIGDSRTCLGRKE